MNVSSDFSMKSNNPRKNNPLLPSTLRMLLIGPCNCGKTNLLLNLILQDGWLDFQSLYILGRSLYQPQYILLRQGLEMGLSKKEMRACFRAKRMIYSGQRPKTIEFQFYTSENDFPPPQDLPTGLRHLIIFDDVLMSNQSIIKDWFIRGRHSNADMIYLTQSYFSLDRKLIRANSNYFAIFRQPYKSLRHLYADYCSDISLEEFIEFCKEVWGKEYNFVSLDLTSTIANRRYRRNWDEFYFPLVLCRKNGM